MYLILDISAKKLLSIFDLSVLFFDILSQPQTQFNSAVIVDFS